MKQSQVFLLVVILLGGFLALAYMLFQLQVAAQKNMMDDASTQLEKILTSEYSLATPKGRIYTLMTSSYGCELLARVDREQESLSVDPSTGALICFWNGPGGQLMSYDSGPPSHRGLTSGILSQITIKSVRFDKEEVVLIGKASSAAEDEYEVKEFFGLEPGKSYELRLKSTELPAADFIQMWKSATPLSDS